MLRLAVTKEQIPVKTQRITKSLVMTVLLALTAACESANKGSHDCKAIAKAISQNDKSSLRSEYDKLMYESMDEQAGYGRSKGSYSLMYAYCVKLDQGRI